ncbi:hypothetical protein HY030_00360 [Candidatus Gottesmanbacteria bacterium]|nr:hypothetical protein [Candidatus Gottesmanbacteria bacterium]
MSTEYQPERKYGGRKFGGYTVFGDHGDKYVNHSPKRQLFEQGFSQACPDPRDVAKKYGLEWTRNRYTDCNLTLGIVMDQALRLNPKLYKELAKTRKRKEPVGLHNSKSVPYSYIKEMTTGAKPEGYTLPRILLEAAGRMGHRSDNNKYFRAMRWLDEVTIESSTPQELVVNLAERITRSKRDGANRTAVLAHMFANEILEEHPSGLYLKQLAQLLKEKAPRLYNHYNRISSEEKAEIGMVDINNLTLKTETTV